VRYTDLQDGDIVTIDAETNELNMDVSEEEIAVRLSKWKVPRLKVNRGTLGKYAYLVGDASHGVRLSFLAYSITRRFGVPFVWLFLQEGTNHHIWAPHIQPRS
jgi:dihydroxy-acid dehydratase